MPMQIGGLVVMVVGAIATAAAVYLEVLYREPRWMVLMKVGAGLFAVGGVLFGVAMS